MREAAGRSEDLLSTSIMLAFRGLVIKTCLIEDQSRCSGCQEAKCCSIVGPISSCLGNKANLQPAGQLFSLQPWKTQGSPVELTVDGIEPWCVAVNSSLPWLLSTRAFPYIFQMNVGGHRGSPRTEDKGVSIQVIYRTVEILNNSLI